MKQLITATRLHNSRRHDSRRNNFRIRAQAQFINIQFINHNPILPMVWCGRTRVACFERATVLHSFERFVRFAQFAHTEHPAIQLHNSLYQCTRARVCDAEWGLELCVRACVCACVYVVFVCVMSIRMRESVCVCIRSNRIKDYRHASGIRDFFPNKCADTITLLYRGSI